MNNDFDDFSNAVDNIKVDRTRPAFEINQLKVEHFHWNSGDIDVGMPVTTSIELTCNYNFEKEKLEWKKTVSHTYLSLENDREQTTDTYDEEIENPNDLIKEIEKNDLRELKNNYFTEENPERFTHWELTYNNYFKIVGTYDQNIVEFEKIIDILNLKKVIDNEVKKVQDKLGNVENIEGIEKV